MQIMQTGRLRQGCGKVCEICIKGQLFTEKQRFCKAAGSTFYSPDHSIGEPTAQPMALAQSFE